MKSYKEIADNVFEKKKQYEKAKAKRVKILTRTLTPVCCICFAGMLVFSAWQIGILASTIPNIYKRKNESKKESVSSVSTVSHSEFKGQVIKKPKKEEPKIVWGESNNADSGENAFGTVGDKNVSLNLIEAMNDSKKNNVFAILITENIDYNFIYNEKSLEQYKTELESVSLYRKKLSLILEDGDLLKNGAPVEVAKTLSSEVKTTETESGYSKEYYDEKVAFYGEEFLSKFILNGEFLVDEVKKEIAEFDQNETEKNSQDAFTTAKNSFYQQSITKIIPELESSGVKYQISFDKTGVIIFVTAEKFKSFTLTNIGSYLFSLATK